MKSSHIYIVELFTLGKMKNQSNDKIVETKNAMRIFLNRFLVATYAEKKM